MPETTPHRRTANAVRVHPPRQLIPRHATRLAGLSVVEDGDGADQRTALDRLGLSDDEFAERIFGRSGIERRQLNLDPEFLRSNLQGRSEQVEDELLRQATTAIDRLDVDLDTVGTVLTSTLYSLGCPTIAHRLIEHYEMAPDTDKYHVTGVGCASAVPLFRLGDNVVRANPSRRVLVVAAESMSSIMVPARAGDERAKTVASAIFGDGCAAAVLAGGRGASGPRVLATSVHQIPGSLHAVTLTSGPQDSYLHLARDLPEIAAENLAALVDDFMHANGLDREQVDHWMLHPGGRRIIERARDALGLDDEDVAISWRALAAHGNIGTPSIFHVLHSTLEQRRPRAGEHALAVTIGPGVSVGLMLLAF